MSKRKVLTLEERIDVIKKHKSGETAISIARTMGVGKTQIQGIVKDKQRLMESWESGDTASKKLNAKRTCVLRRG